MRSAPAGEFSPLDEDGMAAAFAGDDTRLKMLMSL
jgi:hypothetical protein